MKPIRLYARYILSDTRFQVEFAGITWPDKRPYWFGMVKGEGEGIVARTQRYCTQSFSP